MYLTHTHTHTLPVSVCLVVNLINLFAMLHGSVVLFRNVVIHLTADWLGLRLISL